MKVTYYGHSCFGISNDDVDILFDPFITPNPLAKQVNVDDIDCDYLLISHGHEDHVADAVNIAQRTGAKIISNFEIVSWFASQGIDNGHPLNHGGSVHLPFGRIKYVNAVHSSVLPDGTYGGNPGGFVLEFDDLCLYYAGDTALTLDMKLLADEFDIDHAFLPIGDNFTMGVDDAIRAASFINCKSIIGMHYNTFPYIKIDTSDAKAKFESAGANLAIFKVGQTIEI